MSSIIMHIFISQKIQKELNLSDRFLAGAILPDMMKIKTKDRDGTHYIKEYNNGLKRLPDLDKFLNENKDKLKDEIMLGYYAHLIQDRIWFDKYVDSFAKCIDRENILYVLDNTIHDNDEFRKDIYSDYANVDSYIIKENGIDLEDIKVNIKKELKQYDMDEIIDKNVALQIVSNNQEIKLISFECLNNYIDESLKVVKKEIEKILEE